MNKEKKEKKKFGHRWCSVIGKVTFFLLTTGLMQEKKQAAVWSQCCFFLAKFTPFSNKEIAEKNGI
jgi:hypothetical protein